MSVVIKNLIKSVVVVKAINGDTVMVPKGGEHCFKPGEYSLYKKACGMFKKIGWLSIDLDAKVKPASDVDEPTQSNDEGSEGVEEVKVSKPVEVVEVVKVKAPKDATPQTAKKAPAKKRTRGTKKVKK